jgi:hypothetical protein
MDKNWLIRTKSNHILGPVSKEKVLELYQNGSIKSDDEVCSGNGYWFYIREEDMVSRFLTGNETQTFNPISEAKDVLTFSEKSVDIPGPIEDITMVGGLNLSMLNGQTVPESSEKPHSNSTTLNVTSADTKKKNLSEKTSPQVARKSSKKSEQKILKKQTWLGYLGLLGFIILFLMIYFRKSILHHLFKGEVTASEISLFSKAHAQDLDLLKKKSF